MRAFAEAYPEFVQPPVAQIQNDQIMQVPFAQLAQLEGDIIVQPAVAQIPWAHNIAILAYRKNILKKTLKMRW